MRHPESSTFAAVPNQYRPPPEQAQTRSQPAEVSALAVVTAAAGWVTAHPAIGAALVGITVGMVAVVLGSAAALALGLRLAATDGHRDPGPGVSLPGRPDADRA